MKFLIGTAIFVNKVPTKVISENLKFITVQPLENYIKPYVFLKIAKQYIIHTKTGYVSLNATTKNKC